ncbi:hypothetical protein CM15mP37_01580 [bacterium]|nr:MAG: hypothetical protein CM15mP37_01580 [bacterium]
MHTNFKIKSEGEDVVLSNASGKILDSYNTGYIPTDRSKGRIKEGDTWSFFEISTPGQSNDKINYQGFLNSPNINVESGFIIHLKIYQSHIRMRMLGFIIQLMAINLTKTLSYFQIQ